MANESPLVTSLIDQFQSLSTSLNNLTTQVNGSVQVFTAIAGMGQGMNAAAAAMTQATNLISGIPGVQDIQRLGGNVMELRREVGELGKFGAGGGDISGYFAQKSQLGFSAEQMAKIMSDAARPGLGSAGLAQERADTAIKVAIMAKETSLSREQIALSETYLDVLASTVNATIAQHAGLTKSEEGMRELAEIVSQSAAAIDLEARMTGKNRDEIAAETQERIRSTKNTLFMNQLTEEQQIEYKKMLEIVRPMGRSMSDLAEKIASGGRLDESQRQMLGILGPGGIARFEESIRTMTSASASPEEKNRAAKELEAANAQLTAYMNSKEYFTMLDKTSREDLRQRALQIAEENRLRTAIQAEMKRTGLGAEEAQRSLQQRSQLRQAGLTPTGEVDVRQQTQRLSGDVLLMAQEQVGAFAKAVDVKYIKLATENLGELNQEIKKTAEFAFGGTYEDFIKKLDSVSRPVNLPPPGTPLPPPGTPLPPSSATNANTITPGTPLPPPPGSSVSGNGFSLFDPSTWNIFNKGTFGEFGQWWHDFGVKGEPSINHEMEAVVPIDDLSHFIKDSYKQMPHVFEEVRSDIISKMTSAPGVSKSSSVEKTPSSHQTQQRLQQQTAMVDGIPKTKPISDSKPKLITDEEHRRRIEEHRASQVDVKEIEKRLMAELEPAMREIPAAVARVKERAKQEAEIRAAPRPKDYRNPRLPISELASEQVKEKTKAISKLDLDQVQTGKLKVQQKKLDLDRVQVGKPIELSEADAEKTFARLKAQQETRVKTPEFPRVPDMSSLFTERSTEKDAVKPGFTEDKTKPREDSAMLPNPLLDSMNNLGKIMSIMPKQLNNLANIMNTGNKHTKQMSREKRFM